MRRNSMYHDTKKMDRAETAGKNRIFQLESPYLAQWDEIHDKEKSSNSHKDQGFQWNC